MNRIDLPRLRPMSELEGSGLNMVLHVYRDLSGMKLICKGKFVEDRHGSKEGDIGWFDQYGDGTSLEDMKKYDGKDYFMEVPYEILERFAIMGFLGGEGMAENPSWGRE